MQLFNVGSLRAARPRCAMLICQLTKVAFFILFNFSAFASARTQTVTLSANDIAIPSVFREIFRQTGVSVIYNEKIFDHTPTVSINVRNASIQAVLDDCFRNRPFSYTVENNMIFVKEDIEARRVEKPEPPREISGQVTDTLGNVLSGASVTIKGTNTGTTTDSQGRFSLAIKDGNTVLVFSYTGFATTEISIGNKTMINVSLQQAGGAMNDVVVTALGIERQSKSLGFSTQRVKGTEFENTKDLNLANVLVGKVAGLEVNASTEMFIPSDIRLRGQTPLIVVDGSPVSPSSWDLNYNDIENIDVLKGSTAASLYGSAGINGAIVISLKKGRKNRTTVQFTSTDMIQPSLLTSPRIQTEYGSGSGGKYQYQNGSGTALEGGGFTWGPKLDGRQIIQWNSPIDPVTGDRTPIAWVDHSRGKGNLQKFLRTGFTTANNLNFESGNDRGSYRISATQEFQKGIVPNTKLNIYGLSMGGRYAFNKDFEINTSINYSKQHSPNYRIPSYGSNDYIYSLSFWLGNDIDLEDAKNYWEPGQIGIKQRFAQIGYYNNPYFLASENINAYDKDVFYGPVSGDLTLIPNRLLFKVRTGANVNALTQSNEIPVGMVGAPLGNFIIADRRGLTINNDAILSYNKKWSENFSIDALAGTSYLYSKQSTDSMNTNGLVIPLFYNMSNTLNPGSNSNYLAEFQTKSVYANLNLKFWKPLYLSVTGRNDWVSTLPVANNSYFYPSASLSLVLSDWLRLPQALSFLKIRSSVAKVNTGNTGSTYGQIQTYPVGSYNNMPTMQVSRSLIPLNLLPSSSRSYEFGLNVGVLNNRITLDAAFFNRLDYNNIIRQPVPVTSGYTTLTANGRRYETRGVELTLNLIPVMSKNFRWEFDINYYSGHRFLKELENSLKADGYVKVGSRADQIYAYPWLKSPDGELILNAGTGLPQQDSYQRYVGNYDPDFMFGIQQRFRYRKFTVSFSIDGRKGGKYFSILPRMVRAGTSADYDPKARQDAASGLTNYVGKGVVVTSGDVQYDGLGNIVADTRKYSINTTVTNYESWEKSIGNMSSVRAESFLNADYAKLREVAIGCDLPASVIGRAHISSAQVSLFGSNLLLFTRKASWGDDPSWLIGEGTTNSNLKSPSARSFGVQLKVKF